MAFFLFILVNATLFLRPAEIVPELLGVPIYEYLIITCFLLSIPDILQYLLSSSLDTKPITFCVFGILGAIFLSQIAGLEMEKAWTASYLFLKVIVYYLLLVSVVNTPQRFRRFLFWLLIFTVVLTMVTVLQFKEVIRLPTLKALSDTDMDPVTGQEIYFQRLQGTGIFHDPNEFCLMLAIVVPLALYRLTNVKAGFSRFIWLGPLALFFYAIALTHSRGGFLALLAGLGVVSWAWLGARRTLLLGALGVPVLLLGFGGRQTSISATGGTGQSRIQIWSDWITDFRQAPLFGKGMDLPDETKEQLVEDDKKYVAHNSFLHGFTELGLMGGMFFMGAFYLALVSLGRMSRAQAQIVDPEQRRLQPFLLGTLAAFVVGMMALSLCYVVSTYLILGLAVAYARVTTIYPPLPAPRFDLRLAGRLAVVSVMFLAAMYVIVRVFINWA